MFTTRKERDKTLLEILPDIKLPQYDPVIDKVDAEFKKVLDADIARTQDSYFSYLSSWIFKDTSNYSDVLLEKNNPSRDRQVASPHVIKPAR